MTYSLTQNVTYHIVMSWLVDGSSVVTHSVPNMDLDLEIYSPSRTQVASSRGGTQNHEGVRFTPSTTGTHKSRSSTIRTTAKAIFP